MSGSNHNGGIGHTHARMDALASRRHAHKRMASCQSCWMEAQTVLCVLLQLNTYLFLQRGEKNMLLAPDIAMAMFVGQSAATASAAANTAATAGAVAEI